MSEELSVAEAIRRVAFQLQYLGNGDASTPMGAIEAFGKVMMDSLSEVSSAIGGVGEAINTYAEEVCSIAEAIDNHAKAVRMLAEVLEIKPPRS